MLFSNKYNLSESKQFEKTLKHIKDNFEKIIIYSFLCHAVLLF